MKLANRLLSAVCVCALFLAAPVTASLLLAQWHIIPTPSPKNAFGVRFINEKTGFITQWDTKSADILYTNDAGLSWATNLFAGDYLFGTAAADSSHFYAVGYSGSCNCGVIVHSEDGGKQWTPNTDGATFGYYSIAFSSPTNGFAVGYGGMVTSTTDGGDTWNDVVVGDGSDVFKSVAFPSQAIGYALSDSVDYSHPHRIWKTSDGGATWTKIQDYHSGLVIANIAWSSPTSGLLAGNDGTATIYRTTDGGMTWAAVYHGKQGVVLQSVAFGTGAASQIAFAVGDGGVIVRSVDGGLTWRAEDAGVTTSLMDVAVVSSTKIVVVGQNGLTLERTGVQGVASAPVAVAQAVAYPNPAPVGSSVHFSLPANAGSCQIELTNVLGDVVQSQVVSSTAAIPTTGIPAGLYFYRVKNHAGLLATGELRIGA